MKNSNLKNRAVGSFIGLALIVSAERTTQGAIAFTDNMNGTYTASSTTPQVIPDNDPSGIAYALNFSASGLSVTAVTVNFTTSGGQNGDLYAYLSFNNTLVTLLNRVGTGTGTPGSQQYVYGFSTAGFNNVTLDDASVNGNIHNIQNPSSGLSYQPDTVGNTLSSYNGMNPSGDWTLFFADRSGGSVSTLNGFSVNLSTEAVPEPVNVALGIFGGVMGMVVLGKKLKLGKLYC